MESRLMFDSEGKLVGIEGAPVEPKRKVGGYYERENQFKREVKKDFNLKKSDSLSFLREDKKEVGDIFEKSYWSLYKDGKSVEPLKFSNGKTQEDVVKEIVGLINGGNKAIFLHGVCGSGKSAIALNIARVLGKASIVVPVKNLQKQYEDDYMEKMYLLKQNGERVKIAMITGRENHDSVIKPGISCADPFLPENIKLTERNYRQLAEYYKDNPLIKNKVEPDVKRLRRMSIAPANPYWSPILPADFEANQFEGARKKRYLGVDGREYIFYHRKEGCSYYDQYLAYDVADIIIFNSAKYKAEISIGRKPFTDVEIIDEGDEFLDSLFEQEELNLTRFSSSLKSLFPEKLMVREMIDKIIELIELEEKNKRTLGIDEGKVFDISETKIKEILNLLTRDPELESEIQIDEMNYSNRALEAARNFDSFEDIYVTYRKEEENLYVKMVSTNLSAKFNELLRKSKAMV